MICTDLMCTEMVSRVVQRVGSNPSPKLPRKFKTKARFFLLEDLARLIASSNDEHGTFIGCWPRRASGQENSRACEYRT